MKIRPYKNSDKQAVIDLWRDCGLTVPWNDPGKDIERKMQVDPDLFLLGTQDGEVIASVMGGYDGHRGWINYLAVHPDHRRKRYAQQIMQAVEMLIGQRGCPKINLQVRNSNTAVIGFYQSIGYGDDDVIGLGKRLVDDTPGD